MVSYGTFSGNRPWELGLKVGVIVNDKESIDGEFAARHSISLNQNFILIASEFQVVTNSDFRQDNPQIRGKFISNVLNTMQDIILGAPSR